MKKILAMLLALVMVMGLVACGGNAPETTAPAAPAETNPAESTPETTAPAVSDVEYKIAMITDYGDITDQSFNQTTYEACKAFAEAFSNILFCESSGNSATILRLGNTEFLWSEFTSSRFTYSLILKVK